MYVWWLDHLEMTLSQKKLLEHFIFQTQLTLFDRIGTQRKMKVWVSKPDQDRLIGISRHS